MNKIALVSGAVLVLSLVAAPVALADEDDCDAARKALTQAKTRFENRAAEERVEERRVLDEKKAALRAAQVALDEAKGTDQEAAKRELRDAAKDAVDRAQRELDTDSRRLADLRAAVTVALQERDKACDDDDDDDDDTPSTTSAPPADDDVDCTEVSDARAQEILNDDRSDPNNLDEDNDGVACEDDVVIDRVVVPSGGVATGGGPA